MKTTLKSIGAIYVRIYRCSFTFQMKGWMYGCVFTDLDGHKWNILYMDMSKMYK